MGIPTRYVPWSGDGHPTLIGNPHSGYITPSIGLMTIPYTWRTKGGFDPSIYSYDRTYKIKIKCFSRVQSAGRISYKTSGTLAVIRLDYNSTYMGEITLVTHL